MRKTYAPPVISRALALLTANDGNIQRTERDLRAEGLTIARSTLRAWAAGQLPVAAADAVRVPEAQRAALVEVAHEFRGVQRLYLDRAKQPEVVAKTSARDAVLIAAIADDKAFRAEGGPSQTVHHDVRIALVDAGALRKLAAQVTRPAGEIIEGDFSRTEPPDAA